MLYPKFLMNRLISFYYPISQFGKSLLWKSKRASTRTAWWARTKLRNWWRNARIDRRQWRWRQEPTHTTTYREGQTYTYDLPTASGTRREPDSHRGHGQRTSPVMTARRAMKEIPAIAGIIEELTNLSKKGVLTGRHWADLTPTQRSRILRSHTNVTHKVTPASDGTGRRTEKVKKNRDVWRKRYYLDCASYSRGRVSHKALSSCDCDLVSS